MKWADDITSDGNVPPLWYFKCRLFAIKPSVRQAQHMFGIPLTHLHILIVLLGANLPDWGGILCCVAWMKWGFWGWGKSFHICAPFVPGLEGLGRGRTLRGGVWFGVEGRDVPGGPGHFGTRTSG